jgi:hypothetical protein
MTETASPLARAGSPPEGGAAAPPHDAEQEYRLRLLDRQRQARLLGWRERLVGNARVGVFLVGLVVAYLSLSAGLLAPLWVAAVLALFVVLLFVHAAVTRAWYRARRAVAFYEAGLARLADDWKGKGQNGARFQDDSHPCAADIDLFGPGSLFELLCTARTRTGEDTLAGWLRHGAPPDEVRARQQAVAELRPQLDLREDLALLGSELPAGVDFHGVAAWGAAPPVLVARWPRWAALVLGLLGCTCLFGWLMALFTEPGDSAFIAFFDRWGALPLLVMVLIESAFAWWLMGRVNRVLGEVERRGRDLGMLAHVLERLEQATFTAPRLAELHARLLGSDGTGAPPSQRIAALGNLIDLLESRRNQFFAPFAYLLLWGTQMAHAIEAWRAVSGKAIAGWLEVLGQFESLCALSTYAYENASDPFPEIIEQGPCYEGEALGHPLLPRGKCVPNDLALGPEVRVLIVSGSNMSGKSTFLRTVGINAVLALAGAPVRARRLRISPLAIGATLRIQDSLQAGRSRFYAEILRVRQVVDLSRGSVPLLFLLDEIFAGTNSHDRRQGAEAVVRGLVEAGALGLVTTHDLSLTHIADVLGRRAANVHFEDHFEKGVMTFDYRLRSGVVQNSNALALMRAVGLEV